MDTIEKLEIFEIPNCFTKEACARLLNLPPITHHGDEEGHAVHAKNLCLPRIADSIYTKIQSLNLRLNKGAISHVDPFMKLYRLEAPLGAVSQHVDEDFTDGLGRKALYSVIVYLNDDYEGGATVFNGDTQAVHHKAGGFLVFAHDVLHEGLPVTKGTKYVLKTDLFVK